MTILGHLRSSKRGHDNRSGSLSCCGLQVRRRIKGPALYLNVVVVLAAVTLAGCGGPPTAQSTNSPTQLTATPTTAPPSMPPTTKAPAVYKPATEKGPAVNVPVPVMPALAKEFSKEGLIAFTEYWYSTLGYAFETGDAEPMMASSGPECKTCKSVVTDLAPWQTNGRWIVGGQMTVLQINTQFVPDDKGIYLATAMVRQMQLKCFEADGTLIGDPGQKSSVADTFAATYVGGQWMVWGIHRIDSKPS